MANYNQLPLVLEKQSTVRVPNLLLAIFVFIYSVIKTNSIDLCRWLFFYLYYNELNTRHHLFQPLVQQSSINSLNWRQFPKTLRNILSSIFYFLNLLSTKTSQGGILFFSYNKFTILFNDRNFKRDTKFMFQVLQVMVYVQCIDLNHWLKLDASKFQFPYRDFVISFM